MHHSALYTIGFAAAVCIVCSFLVSTSAVTLKDRQDANALLEKQKNVLMAAGLMKVGETLNRDQIKQRFSEIEVVVLDLKTGTTYSKAKTPDQFDSMLQTANNPKQNQYQAIYQVLQEGKIELIVLPIVGKGLWSTMYGFLALEGDLNTIRGITYYQHGETPGLGGEVDNPRWKAKWVRRKVYDEQWNPAIRVIKGSAGSVEEAPYEVDGLSGATLTSRGVSAMLKHWLGDEGYGPFLKKLRQEGNA